MFQSCNMTYNEKKSLYESIMNDVAKIVKQHINELSSSKYDDVADYAEKIHATDLAKKLRQVANDARERENKEKSGNILNIVDSEEINGSKFYIAKYVPSNIDVLVYKNESKKTCAVVRIKKNDNSIVSIKDKDILSEIAKSLNCKVVGSIAILNALESNSQYAKKLSDKINSALNTNISWRYFIQERK